jgi:AAA domain-containing protein
MTDTSYEDIKAKHTTGNGRDYGPSRALSYRQLRELPDPVYIVKGLIDRGSLVEIYGPHGSGKSFFAGDIGLHVALGRSWRKRRVNQGAVLYIAAEGGTNIKRRMAAFAQHHNVDLDEVPFFVVLAPTNMLTPAGIAQVIADAGSIADLSMVIVDTAARVMPGGKEDAEDMGAFIAACDEIRSKTGAAVIVVHHTGKNLGAGSRGSSLLPAAVDSMIEVNKDDKLHVAEHVKSRDGETGTRFGFKLLVIPLGEDADRDPITSCIVVPIEASDKADGANLTGDEKAYWNDISNFFAREQSPIETVTPELGSVSVRAATRNAIRDWLRHRGRFSVSPGVALSPTDRTKFNRTLNHLRDKGKLGMTEEYLWLLP